MSVHIHIHEGGASTTMSLPSAGAEPAAAIATFAGGAADGGGMGDDHVDRPGEATNGGAPTAELVAAVEAALGQAPAYAPDGVASANGAMDAGAAPF